MMLNETNGADRIRTLQQFIGDCNSLDPCAAKSGASLANSALFEPGLTVAFVHRYVRQPLTAEP
jgi:hypothetical protein